MRNAFVRVFSKDTNTTLAHEYHYLVSDGQTNYLGQKGPGESGRDLASVFGADGAFYQTLPDQFSSELVHF